MKFNYANPYPSARLPVFARNLVATSQPIAAQAGLAVLRQGGNAVDAAVATAAAMTVCEPTGNGLGSDAFCILWDGQQLHGLNASGPAPQGWSSAYFQRKYGAGASSPPLRGIDSVTVPGAVGAWAALHARFGHLPFDQVLAPAVDLAENGYLVPVVMQPKWAAGAAELGAQPGFAATFLPNGRPPAVGEVFRMPNAARALRLIGQTRGAAFYQGEIAAKYAAETLKVKKVAVLYGTGDPYSSGVGKAFVAAAKKNGLDVVAEENSSSADDTEYSSQLQKIEASGAEFLYAPYYYSTVGPYIVPQARAVGYEGYIMGPDGYDGLKTTGNKANYNKVLYTTHYSPDDKSNTKVQQFITSSKKANNGESPNTFTATSLRTPEMSSLKRNWIGCENS